MNRRTMKLAGMVLAAGVLLAARGLSAAETGRERISMDLDWSFHLGEVTDGQKVDLDDKAWRQLSVPHDYSIEGPVGADKSTMEGPFDRKSPAGDGGGYLNGGVAWYRKSFTVPASEQGEKIAVQFDGVYMNSDVYLNGQLLGNHPYGYTSFEYDLTPYLKFGSPNVLAVRTNVQQPCSRWYSGGGIYRHVYLESTGPVHIPQWGTYITTPEVTAAAATVKLRTKVQNESASDADVTVVTRVTDPTGKQVAEISITSKVAAGKTEEVAPQVTIGSPAMWSTETPVQYTAVSEVTMGGKVVDSITTKFGIRTLEFTADKGFLLNGKHLQIQGVCDHHDLGALGSAVNKRAIERQLEILKSFGVNAIRTSHNPPAPELLDLCDSMGFVVMDESFDEWKSGKTRNGYGRFFDEWSERDMVSMLHRDRNHPSIVLWSIGNEIREQGSANGHDMAQRLTDICHREDPTRMTTSACNSADAAVRTGYNKGLDVFGINYSINQYIKQKGQLLIASETSSALSTRGEYNLVPDDAGKLIIKPELNNQVSSYEVAFPKWGHRAEVSLAALKTSPWVAGEFVWTGFDYIGEPTPYAWPARSSYFGIVDLAGFPKDRFYLYQSQWTTKPVVHLLPHWNWAGYEGKEIPVWCFTNADTVELFLNGKSLGVKTNTDRPDVTVGYKADNSVFKQLAGVKSYHMEWQVPYAPGTLKAVGTKDGKVIASDEVFTAGAPAKLELTADRSTIATDGEDLSFVTVRVLDSDGHICPNADNQLNFSITGPGTIAATDNGDPINHESFQAPTRKVFHGMALVILKGSRQAGQLTLKTSAEGLPAATLNVATVAK